MPQAFRARIRYAFLSAFCLLATAPTLVLASGTPMTGAEFDAYTQGKTLYFYSQGQAYGVEEYRPDRRVTWSFLDGRCQQGFWYEQDQQICFVYEDNPDPQCWTFYAEPNGLRALFQGDPQATELYEAGDADEPMLCYGPDVGV